ncbi:MAG: PSD1 and planctomycete cytochrome C domain-containing protein [Candidatus Cyclobacteriaceae bacterium M3_2C_046]
MVLSNTSQTEDALPKVVDYNFHIRPILSDNCFACHGPDAKKREAGLRLDIAEDAFRALGENGDRFAFVPGEPQASEVFHRISSPEPDFLMPPPESNLKLSAHEIKLIKKWIEQGAAYRKHWAFTPPEKSELPETKYDDWAQNEIDFFIFKKLEQIGLKPNQEADKERLLKRLSFDITGLPPSVEMQERFLADGSTMAYEKMVDELLQSSHYGEKMAIHWLDVARYADSHGYQDDGLRTMWPWRDWVIHAFNQNYPYDQFVTWQLAGDLLPNPTKEQLLATGFNRNHKITQEGGVIDEEYRIEYVTDRTNTFGKAFMALTFECAKCHDHKYDPISQEAYYSTFAFFNKVPEKGIVGTIDASFADPPNMKITEEDVSSILSFINKKDTAAVGVMIMEDSAGIRTTHILDRGNYDSPTEQVHASTPKAILPFDTTKYAPNRLGLAQWMMNEKHPLTARVFVNRIWQEIMGRGIVATSGDFGMQGDLPTHLELLDWLAVDFRENGWDIKRLVKQIVMSATYRQTSQISPKKRSKDPENLYFSWFPRNRLPAELVRDHVLASSGLLNPEIGGPSIKPYQPDGLWQAATSGRGLLQKYIMDEGDDLYRRGMYIFIKRTVPPPSMLMFDASNRDQCEVRRVQTSTPLQSLVMLNDPHVLEASRVLAEQLIQQELSLEEQIRTAFRRVVCRKIKDSELELLMGYYQDEIKAFAQYPAQADSLIQIGAYPKQRQNNVAATAALMQIIHTMYNLEEAITKT